jgi:hypothetical protein
MLRRMYWLIAAMSVLVVVIAAGSGGAASIPSGERTFAQNRLEPVYNDEQAGEIGYIMVPTNTAQPVPSNPAAWAPFYLVVYPVGSTAASTFLCMHVPVENCPSHGDGISALAQAREPGVYGSPGSAGVLGHDHLMDFPGGRDFNIAWEPMVVLFTSKAAANEHVLTDTRIDELVASGDAIVVPRPTRTFICASVPARLYDMATPLVP